jgi:hypothetical protein
MQTPTLEPLTDVQVDARFSFKVYLNYLVALSDYVGHAPHQDDALPREIAASEAFSKLQGKPGVDLHELGRLLRIGWFSELQLLLPSEFPESVTYANHWAPVQAYYAVYLAIRAYLHASGQIIPHVHASTLKAIAREIHQRQGLFPLPWRVLCVGNPESKFPECVGLPTGARIEKISPLSSPRGLGFSFWSSLVLLLKTTRERQLVALNQQWKRDHSRKRVSPEAKRAHIRNLAPTSIFHALYRFRIRSNYEDADVFLMGALDESEARRFNDSIRNVTWSSMIVLEMLIARCIGKKKYEEIIQSFQVYDPRGVMARTAPARWRLFEPLW